MVRRPTRLALLPVLATVVLAALAVLTHNGWLLVLAGASTGLFLAGLVLPPQVAGLVVCLLGPSRLAVGEQGTYELHVHNRGTRTSSLASLTQRIRGFPDLAVLVEELAPGESAVLSVDRWALTRGATRRCEVVLTSSAPLGLHRVTRTVSRVGVLVVHPAPVPPAPVPAAPGSPTGVAAAERGAAPVRAGVDFCGVRDWRPGDAGARVHWRSTARRGRLMVTERTAVRPGAVTMLLAAISADDDWEQTIALAAATACVHLEAGRPVTLIALQDGAPTVCSGSRGELLDWCAGLGSPRLPDAETLHLATDRAGGGGTVLVVASAAVPALWWAWAREIEGRENVRLVPLRAAPVVAGPVW
jgi:uncharacterized protein (DUF58 family)